MRARLLLLAAALAAFGASLGSGFHFDDYAIFSDPVLGSTSGWLGVWSLRQTRPLTYLTFWMNRQIGGGDALGYHLLNLALHLGAVVLVWECLRRLIPERAAFIAAAIFAMHPLQAEAVDYIWARSIVLAALLCLVSLWNWLAGRPWVAVAWFLLALLAKEECAAFPLFLLWTQWRGAVPSPVRRWPPLLGMFALSLAAGVRVIYATAVTPGAPAGFGAGISPAKYLFTQGHVILRYFQLLVAPYGFTVDPEISPAPLLAAAAWVLLPAAVFLLLRKVDRSIATWAVAGLLLLLPSSSIFPAADLAADRRMYFAMFAFAAALGLVLERIPSNAVLAAIGVVLLGTGVARTVVWMSDESLWREAVERAPDKLRPKIQLARALPAAKGLEILTKARIAAPHDATVAAETGRILLAEGQADAALEEFGRALALDPMNAQYVNNRGVVLQALGQTEAARADFMRAIGMDPKLAEARENLAKLPPRPE